MGVLPADPGTQSSLCATGLCGCVRGVSKERGSLGIGVGKFPSYIMVIS